MGLHGQARRRASVVRWLDLCLFVVTVSLLSCVRLFVTSWTIVRRAPLSLGILQARILEWAAMPSSRGSSQPKDRTHVSGVSRNWQADS